MYVVTNPTVITLVSSSTGIKILFSYPFIITCNSSVDKQILQLKEQH